MEKGNKDNGFYFEKKVNETFSSWASSGRGAKILDKDSFTLYDSLYIILARNLKPELATSGKKQAEKAREAGVNSIFV